jgi:hypothetical protein
MPRWLRLVAFFSLLLLPALPARSEQPLIPIVMQLPGMR